MNQYESEAVELWGERAERSIALYNSYTEDQKRQVQETADENYREIAKLMEQGKSPDSPEVQKLVASWHEYLFYFYEPSLEILSWLGAAYKNDERFHKYYDDIAPNLADYFSESISSYVDELETRWLESQYLALEE